VVEGVASLNSFPRTAHSRYVGQVRMVTGQPGLQPLFTVPVTNGNFYGLGPADFA
jgi:hypothetical protein